MFLSVSDSFSTFQSGLRNGTNLNPLSVHFHCSHTAEYTINISNDQTLILDIIEGRRRRTQYQQYSFLPRTTRDWNDLPQEVIEAKTIDTFVSRASRLH